MAFPQLNARLQGGSCLFIVTLWSQSDGLRARAEYPGGYAHALPPGRFHHAEFVAACREIAMPALAVLRSYRNRQRTTIFRGFLFLIFVWHLL
jgi:hypothetical protein